MTNKYPSTYIQEYPIKMAFLIDCVHGLNSYSLSPRFIDNFPVNSDIFLFYPNYEPEMNRRLRRIETSNHGVFYFPTSEYGLTLNLSFILGQIYDKYDDFIFIVARDPAYEDICHQLVTNNSQLHDHIQVRAFERTNEFEQFLREMSRLESNDNDKQMKHNKKIVMNYTRKHLFHPCPLETKEESSNLYRFGELLHHLDTEHPNVHYEYCTDCQTILENHNLTEQEVFEEHIRDKHWTNTGFQLTIRHP